MSILEKVRKLRLVAEKSTNENESHNAWLLAQRLMLQHGISEDQANQDPTIRDAGPGSVVDKVVISERSRTYFTSVLCSIIGHNFRCTYYFYDHTAGVCQYHMLGRESHVDIAGQVVTGAHESAHNLAGLYVQKRRDDAEWMGIDLSTKELRDMRLAYLTGFLTGLREKFVVQVKDLALTIVKDGEVIEAAQKLGLRVASTAPGRREEVAAYQNGFMAGKSHHPRTGGTNQITSGR